MTDRSQKLKLVEPSLCIDSIDPKLEESPRADDKIPDISKRFESYKKLNSPTGIQEEDETAKTNKELQSSMQKQVKEEDTESESSHLPPEIKQKWVNRFFYIQFAANLLMMIDMGILPACSVKMQNELKISTGPFGMLGSMVYLGQTIGSFLATYFLQKMPTKLILSSCLILNTSSLILFTLTDIYWIIALCRVLTGLFQIFFVIYFPVWADCFGNDNQKSIWLSYLIIASPLGNIFGYILSACIQDTIGWKWAFYLQALMMVPAMIGIMVTPRKYLDIQESGKLIKEFQEQKLKNEAQQSNDPEQAERVGQEGEGEIDDSKTSLARSEQAEELTLMKGLKVVMKNRNFLKMCFALTVLYFVLTGVQFWFSDYLITVMNVNKATVFTIFGAVSITGPVLGVIVGGYVTTALGGYNSEKALYTTLGLSCFCLVSAMPIPFIYNNDLYIVVVVLLWFLLFAGGFILPCMTGIMLNTVDQQLRTSANSVANAFYNFLGFLPAPFLYGYIADIGEGEGNNKRQAMQLLMMMPVFAFMFLGSAVYTIVKERECEATKIKAKENQESEGMAQQ